MGVNPALRCNWRSPKDAQAAAKGRNGGIRSQMDQRVHRTLDRTHRLDVTQRLVLVVSSVLFLLLGLAILAEQFVDIFATLS